MQAVDEDQESKNRNHATTAAELPLGQTQKWEEVGSRLPSVFEAIEPSRRGSTCYSQFNQLRQRLKRMRTDHRNRFRRANGKRDPVMTNELCWKITEYLSGRHRNLRPGHEVDVSNVNLELSTAANQVVQPIMAAVPLSMAVENVFLQLEMASSSLEIKQ
ncbi:unnamed protein product [Calypogeia fissa]